MAQRVQIMCINKTNRTDRHEKISHVGGVNANGTRWKLTQAEAIQGIEEGKWSFYVSREGRTVNVIIGISQYGHKYLKTENDNTVVDNLLSLPECP